MPRLSEALAWVPLVESKDYGSAGILSDAVNLGLMDGSTAYFTFGNLTGNSILLVYASAARDLATTAIAFSYRLTTAVYKAASGTTAADQFGDPVAVTAAGLTLVAATFAHKGIVIEIDPDTLPAGKPWLTFNIDATATAMNVAAVMAGASRYPGHTIPSVL